MSRRYRKRYPPLSAEEQAKIFRQIEEEEEFEAAEWWVVGVPLPESQHQFQLQFQE